MTYKTITKKGKLIKTGFSSVADAAKYVKDHPEEHQIVSEDELSLCKKFDLWENYVRIDVG